MSGGLSWDLMCGPLVEKISPLQGVVFCAYVAFTVLALMNVVTGVFVQGALEAAKKDESEFMWMNLRQMFNDADADDDGKLSSDEFQLALARADMQEYLKTIDVNPDEAETLFKVLDLDGSGNIDYDEFVHGCLRLKGNAKAIDFFTLQHDQKLWMRQVSKMLDD